MFLGGLVDRRNSHPERLQGLFVIALCHESLQALAEGSDTALGSAVAQPAELVGFQSFRC